MFPTFQGGQNGEAPLSARLVDGQGQSGDETPYVRCDDGPMISRAGPLSADDQEMGAVSWTEDRGSRRFDMPVSRAPAAAMPSSEVNVTNAMVSALSFLADAKLGAQVARVNMGIDAKVRKARESQLFMQLGLKPSIAQSGGAGADVPEPDGLRSMIQGFQDSQRHLDTVLAALEDYQRHRQGLADSAQRLGMALQEAGQRAPGLQGDALIACGSAHFRAAECRREAHATEELRSISKLRAHHGKAAADCRRTVSQYESTRQELELLQQARACAQEAKQVGGDSPLTPAVESGAERAEEDVKFRLQGIGETACGKLSMFRAKHAADYAESIAFHMQNTVAEEQGVNNELSGVVDALANIGRTPEVEIVHE